MGKGVKRARNVRESLRFVPSGKVAGFRSSGLSAYNNVDPHTVVRELVQNSLDAAVKAKRDVVRVLFEIDEVAATDVPARADYQEHLRWSVDSQRKKGNLEQSRIDRGGDGVVHRGVTRTSAMGNGQRRRTG